MRRAGLLNEPIEIYKVVITKSDYGEESETLELRNATKASLKHNSGNRSIENDEIVHNYNKSFTVRYYVEVDEFDKIKWDNKFYRVLDIEPNKQYTYKVINTELIND